MLFYVDFCYDLLMKTSVQVSVEALQSQVQTLSQEVASRDEKIASLEEQLAWFKRQIFGKKSERIVSDLDQQQLFF